MVINLSWLLSSSIVCHSVHLCVSHPLLYISYPKKIVRINYSDWSRNVSYILDSYINLKMILYDKAGYCAFHQLLYADNVYQVNPLTAKLFNWNFQPHEVVSR